MISSEQREQQRKQKQMELFRSRSSQNALRWLRRIREWKHHRPALEPFYDILQSVYQRQPARRGTDRRQGKPPTNPPHRFAGAVPEYQDPGAR